MAGLSRFIRAERESYLKLIEVDRKWDDSVIATTEKIILDFNRQFGVEGTPPAEANGAGKTEPEAKAGPGKPDQEEAKPKRAAPRKRPPKAPAGRARSRK
jgi:hypothetical protein